MPEKVKEMQPPSGLLRFAFRTPLLLYRLGLGWLLGDRFLELTHTGRKSGEQHKTVLEVVRHDKRSDTFYVVSGWGEKADWYRNVMTQPRVSVRSGGKHYEATAERLSPEQAGEEMLDYYHRHPLALKELARIMGYRLDNSEDDVRALGESLPVIALRPQE